MPFRRQHLRYFVTVAQEGQITRAAAKLHMAQPALSQAIAQLESELGVGLLERQARGVKLTSAGEAFLPKALAVVDREHEVELTGQALARAAQGVLALGFVGPPPTMSIPHLFAAFAADHPDVEIHLRDLSFPRGSTLSWLEEVDVAFCHRPALEPGVRTQTVSLEPRGIITHRSHPLADRDSLGVADVLDETFVSYHPDVQAAWAGFHSLDDHRGKPARLTAARALIPPQMLAIIASRRAITTVPASDADFILKVLRGVVAIPLHDAHPAVLALVWRNDNHNPLVEALAAIAENLAERRPLQLWRGAQTDDARRSSERRFRP